MEQSMSRGVILGTSRRRQFALSWSLLTSDRSVSGTHGRGCSSGWRERPEVASTSARIPRLARSLPFRRGWAPSARVVVKERCESGRIGLTANELTWETGSQGSNPCLSAEANRQAKRAIAVRCGSSVAGTIQHWLPDVNNFGWCPPPRRPLELAAVPSGRSAETSLPAAACHRQLSAPGGSTHG